jgi:hypothetical protein
MPSVLPLVFAIFFVLVVLLLILSLISMNFNFLVIFPECKDLSKSKLVEINRATPVCKEKEQYYISKYDMVVSETPIPIENVCLQLCTDPECNKKDEKKNYLNCLDTFKDFKCNGIPPLAHKGNKLYYAYSPGNCQD